MIDKLTHLVHEATNLCHAYPNESFLVLAGAIVALVAAGLVFG